MPRREQTGKKKGASDTGVVEKKSEPLYCICKRREDEVKDDFMIECEACENWFHGRCMSLPDRIADDLEKYYCSACSPQHGPSVFKQRCNFHRRDYSDPLAEGKPVQTGTQTFINSLKRRVFLNSDSIIIRLKGSQLNVNYFYENGFTKPIFIANKEGLDISVPAKSITLKEISELVGPNKFVDVIDTERQATYSMLLNDFIDYFESFERTKTYNVLSLEVSNTKLGESIVTPQVVRDLSWATIGIWPKKRGEDEKEDSDNANVKKTEWSQQSGRKRNESSESSSGENDISYDEENFEHYERPEVAKYCLISPKDSYTDFHVDFGGSSVWYHILKGEKIFYLVEPTDENLQKYIEWNRSGNESETFFGDLVSTCYKMQLREENTILIPAGWIHAVYTPCDSLVFGGNFLNSLSVDIQLRVYELERMAQVPHKFQFPLFETFHWYAAKHYYDEIRAHNEAHESVSDVTKQAADAILRHMSQWLLADKKYQFKNRRIIPKHINCEKLLRDLASVLEFSKTYNTKSSAQSYENLKIILPLSNKYSSELVQFNGSKSKLKDQRSSDDALSFVSSTAPSTSGGVKLTIKTGLKNTVNRISNADDNTKSIKIAMKRESTDVNKLRTKQTTNLDEISTGSDVLTPTRYTLDLEAKRQRFISSTNNELNSTPNRNYYNDEDDSNSSHEEGIGATNLFVNPSNDKDDDDFVLDSEQMSYDYSQTSSRTNRIHTRDQKLSTSEKKSEDSKTLSSNKKGVKSRPKSQLSSSTDKDKTKSIKKLKTSSLKKDEKKSSTVVSDASIQPLSSDNNPSSSDPNSLAESGGQKKSLSSTTRQVRNPKSKKKLNPKDRLGKILKIANSIKSRGGILT